jgi:hypothetical protein
MLTGWLTSSSAQNVHRTRQHCSPLARTRRTRRTETPDHGLYDRLHATWLTPGTATSRDFTPIGVWVASSAMAIRARIVHKNDTVGGWLRGGAPRVSTWSYRVDLGSDPATGRRAGRLPNKGSGYVRRPRRRSARCSVGGRCHPPNTRLRPRRHIGT